MADFTDVFISAATTGYAALRQELATRLKARHIAADEQSRFTDAGALTLVMLEDRIKRSQLVVHLLVQGNPGGLPTAQSVRELKRQWGAALKRLQEVASGPIDWFDMDDATRPSYTEWEALIALFLGVRLKIFDYQPKELEPGSEARLARHRARLALFERGRPNRIVPVHSVDELAEIIAQACSEFLPPRNKRWPWPEVMTFDQKSQKLSGFSGRARLIDEIDEWLAGRPSRPLLLQAPFGVGKTALMARLAQRDPLRTVSHFCVFSDNDTLDPRRIARSLARQFAERIPRYRDKVDRSESLQRLLDDENPSTIWLKGVVAELDFDEDPILMLIDGLDESLEFHGRQDGGTLLEMIVRNGGVTPMPDWLRVIMSSRNVPQLALFAQSCTVIDIGPGDVRHEGENRQDIAEFIRRAITGVPSLQESLRQAPGGLETFVDRLVDACDGKFLLARMWTEEFASGQFDPADLLRERGAHAGSLLDEFYARTFRRRIALHDELDAATVASVLGVIAAAREPLPYQALADILKRPVRDVTAVCETLGGLLTWNEAQGGVMFEHYSLKRWLDPQTPEGLRGGQAKAGDYAIDVDASRRAIVDRCGELASMDDPLRSAGSFKTYLRKHGVEHLIDDRRLPSALQLLDLLRQDAGDDAAVMFDLRQQELLIIEVIRRHLPSDAGTALQPELADIPASRLLKLVTSRDYETDKFEPAIRLLLMGHFDEWLKFKKRLQGDDGEADGIVIEQDLVLRHDIGVAFAEAWHATPTGASRRLLGEILHMGSADSSGDLREIAGYAIKHICQRRRPKPWYLPIANQVRGLLVDYALAASSTDRMVAGEAALALAIQDAPILDWLPAAGPTADFWTPVWPNLQADIDAIRVVLAARRPPQLLAGLRDTPGHEACRRQHELAAELRRRLEDSALFASAAGERVLDAFDSLASQQNDAATVDDFIGSLERALDDEHARQDGYDFIRLLMLHPLWNETERAANLVSRLLKRPGGDKRWWIVERLMDEPAELWRLRYGAVDSAYTAGTRDDFALFRRAVLRLGSAPDSNCRVRGICTDDLWAWLDRMPHRRRRQELLKPDIAGLLKGWLATADDHWQLEYLHEIFSTLFVDADGLRNHALLDRFGMPSNAELSPFLRFDSTPFHEVGHDEFMEEIERRARAMHARPSS